MRRIVHEYGEPLEAEVGVYALEEIFWIIGRVKHALKKADQEDRAREFVDKAFRAGPDHGVFHGCRRVDDGTIATVPAEATVVECILRRAAEGRNLPAIAKALGEERAPTRDGGAWRPSTIRGMLRNRFYPGRITPHLQEISSVSSCHFGSHSAHTASATSLSAAQILNETRITSSRCPVTEMKFRDQTDGRQQVEECGQGRTRHHGPAPAREWRRVPESSVIPP